MRRVAVVALAALVVTPPAHAATVSYRLTLAPREALFGDPVEPEVDVVVDATRVAPSTVRLHADFRPYRVAAATVSRRRSGDLERIVYRWRLDCLVRGCLPGGPERRVQFAPVRIVWSGGEQTAFWPPLRVASRIDPRDLLQPTVRSDVIRQPPVTYAVSPSAVEAILIAVGALLLGYPALRLVRLAVRRWRRLRLTRLERLTPLERALELLRRAAAAGDVDPSRRALERVARELGDDELVGETRRLAWSRPRPESTEMDSLRTRVEERP